jgi:ubiquinone/menaquinone biosynthesis C-methylase UbiE
VSNAAPGLDPFNFSDPGYRLRSRCGGNPGRHDDRGDGKCGGVDIVPEMLERAETNLRMTGLKNVSFKKTSGENLPFPDDSFEVVISNGAINLIPDKESALIEIFRG